MGGGGVYEPPQDSGISLQLVTFLAPLKQLLVDLNDFFHNSGASPPSPGFKLLPASLKHELKDVFFSNLGSPNISLFRTRLWQFIKHSLKFVVLAQYWESSNLGGTLCNA